MQTLHRQRTRIRDRVTTKSMPVRMHGARYRKPRLLKSLRCKLRQAWQALHTVGGVRFATFRLCVLIRDSTEATRLEVTMIVITVKAKANGVIGEAWSVAKHLNHASLFRSHRRTSPAQQEGGVLGILRYARGLGGVKSKFSQPLNLRIPPHSAAIQSKTWHR